MGIWRRELSDFAARLDCLGACMDRGKFGYRHLPSPSKRGAAEREIIRQTAPWSVSVWHFRRPMGSQARAITLLSIISREVGCIFH